MWEEVDAFLEHFKLNHSYEVATNTTSAIQYFQLVYNAEWVSVILEFPVMILTTMDPDDGIMHLHMCISCKFYCIFTEDAYSTIVDEPSSDEDGEDEEICDNLQDSLTRLMHSSIICPWWWALPLLLLYTPTLSNEVGLWQQCQCYHLVSGPKNSTPLPDVMTAFLMPVSQSSNEFMSWLLAVWRYMS